MLVSRRERIQEEQIYGSVRQPTRLSAGRKKKERDKALKSKLKKKENVLDWKLEARQDLFTVLHVILRDDF